MSGPHYGVRTLTHKLIYFYNQPLDQPGANEPSDPPEWELYDLVLDQFEMNNVCGDPAYGHVVDELKAELARLQEMVGDSAD